MASASEPRQIVKLGFAEKAERNWLLLNCYFPSKVGGKPAWLSLHPLPPVKVFLCTFCSAPRIFLMQVYAPDNELSNAFHRTIFVFVCRNASCKSLSTRNGCSILVLRSQLPRANKFYPETAPDENNYDDTDQSTKPETHSSLCNVCGVFGDKKCGKCHEVWYCCRDHQVIDWKSSHKQSCQKDVSATGQDVPKLLFPEFELVTEEEEDHCQDKEKDEVSKMAELKEFMQSEKGEAASKEQHTTRELEAMAGSPEDEVFEEFKTRTNLDPEQVLRYDRGGQPLWIAAEPHPTQVPKCEHCGAERQFEFQIMPQLLLHLNTDSTAANSLDWGVIAVYTCSASCNVATDGYVVEYSFQQDVTQ